MDTESMSFCCKAYEVGEFDYEDGGEQSVLETLKNMLNNTGNVKNVRIFFATTVSRQKKAIKALKALGFTSTVGKKLNSYPGGQASYLRGWMLAVPAGKEF